jgi:tetratricopeptide (TPR) repeat protein
MKISGRARSEPRLVALLAAGGLALGLPVLAQEQPRAIGDRLGTVEFSVGCTAAAQDEFTRAMSLYHSFAWSQAASAFEAVAEADPECGMAHWGRAMVVLDNPFLWPGSLTPEKLDAVAAALEEARAAGLHDAREEGYVAALEAFVRDRDTLDHRARVQAFEEGMGEVAAANPDDVEASVLHALITSANFDPADRTYANQMRAAEILEPLFAEHPDHPGLAHYLIHTYDYPPLASDGLQAARRYSEIAPDAPHALHMPSHIFTRVGHWKESIESNRASGEVDGGSSYNSHHAADYKVYAHLQLAQDHAAETVIEDLRFADEADHFAAAFAYAAMPARIALERGDWEGAMALELVPAADAYPWEKYPHAEAINAFARGVGAARAGDAEAAGAQRARLEELRDATGPAYWVEQVDIQADIVGALALCAEDRSDECIEALREAAAREDATEKHVVTPGPILPAREILADILLEQGRAEEALAEYEAVLVKEPNRYRALAGAAEAAEMAGDHDAARRHAAHLVEQAEDADTERPTLERARTIAAAE